MIEIMVNGEKQEVEERCTIEALITQLGYQEKKFVVALNQAFVSMHDYPTTKIKAGDSIEILSPMSGG